MRVLLPEAREPMMMSLWTGAFITCDCWPSASGSASFSKSTSPVTDVFDERLLEYLRKRFCELRRLLPLALLPSRLLLVVRELRVSRDVSPCSFSLLRKRAKPATVERRVACDDLDTDFLAPSLGEFEAGLLFAPEAGAAVETAHPILSCAQREQGGRRGE